MTVIEAGEARRRMSRRSFIHVGAASAAAVYLNACGGSSGPNTSGGNVGAVNWLTWGSHFTPQELAALRKSGIDVNVQLFGDDSEAYAKAKQPTANYQVISLDALWAPKFVKEGLTEPFDIGSVSLSNELYSVAREFPFWKSGSQYMSYPLSWSPLPVIYDPTHVSPEPDSWEALLDPKYRNKIIGVGAATAMMAIGGAATGARQPYDMTEAEQQRAQAYLRELKPNLLKLANQNGEIDRELTDGTVWLAIGGTLGTIINVKNAGGPRLLSVLPKERTIGFIDGQNKATSFSMDHYLTFLNESQKAKWCVKIFLQNSVALWNERAYKMLVNMGKKEEADAVYYNRPEIAAGMALPGAGGDLQGVVDKYNEVFGA